MGKKFKLERFAWVGKTGEATGLADGPAMAPRVVMAMRSREAMRKLVEAGVGISFLPCLTVEHSLQTGELKEVGVKGVHFSRETGVAWKKDATSERRFRI